MLISSCRTRNVKLKSLLNLSIITNKSGPTQQNTRYKSLFAPIQILLAETLILLIKLYKPPVQNFYQTFDFLFLFLQNSNPNPNLTIDSFCANNNFIEYILLVFYFPSYTTLLRYNKSTSVHVHKICILL